MDENASKFNKDFVRNEIDYKIILTKIWAGKKIVALVTLSGIIIGLLVALLSPKEFKVVTTMLPQSESESGLGKFSSLAAIAGFDLNLGQSGTEISPVIYPQIVESAPFLEELMSTPFKFSKVDHPVSLFDYYLKVKKPSVFEFIYSYTIGLPYTLKTVLRKETVTKKGDEDKKFYMYTKDQSDLMLMMKNRVVLTINKKEGYLTLTTIMPEAMLTAQVAEKSQEILQKTITQYKIEGATEQLRYVEQRYKEKKAEFEKAQQRLAYYNDRNQNINTSMAKTELDRLQSEYDIANSVYSELAKLLEQSKLQVKKRTPVFTIIKPVVVPNEKFKPKRMTILAIWTILGLVGGISVIAVREYFFYMKTSKKSKIE